MDDRTKLAFEQIGGTTRLLVGAATALLAAAVAIRGLGARVGAECECAATEFEWAATVSVYAAIVFFALSCAFGGLVFLKLTGLVTGPLNRPGDGAELKLGIVSDRWLRHLSMAQILTWALGIIAFVVLACFGL